jgi:phospholipase/lecithinase/hemolysin
MQSRFQRALAGAALLAALAAQPAGAAPFSNVVFFGDSLSDVGNVFLATGGALPGPGGYLGGRFSNGPVWVEHLAAGLGHPAAAGPSLAGGNNYAFGGARTGTSTTPPGLLTQAVGLWGTSHPTADPDALYVVAGGGNDMRDARSAFGGTSIADQAGRQAAAAQAVGNLVQVLAYLAAKGAQHVLLTNVPDLGLTPEAGALGSRAASADASARFNALIPGALLYGAGLGLDMKFLDLVALNQKVINDATNHGGTKYGITNVTLPCAGFAGSLGSPCASSLFSDALHPSGATHLLMGKAALRAVPEPATLVLFTLGVTSVVRRRRRA